MAEKREGKRLAQKRRWDYANKRTVCKNCGTLIWYNKGRSGLCKSCITKLRPRDEHGNFLPKQNAA